MSMESEGQKPTHIEFEGPTHLVEGQNFYEQQPFINVLQYASDKTGYHIDRFRRGLSRIAWIKSADTSNLSSAEQRKERYKVVRTIDKMVQSSTESDLFLKGLKDNEASSVSLEGIKDIFSEALCEMNMKLEPYPQWNEYIKAKLSSTAFYLKDGSYKTWTGRVKYEPEPTYGLWLTEQQRVQKQRILWGIQEVFPEEVNPREVARGTGAREVHRRWIIHNQIR